MEDQILMIELMWRNINRNVKQFMKEKKNSEGYYSRNYMNKDHGKYALKRKIIMLRQELKNLERMIENNDQA